MTQLAETPFTLARRMTHLKPSAVREILAAAGRADVTSFAGGLPAPELFPAEAISGAMARVLANNSTQALQYGITEGLKPLREWIAGRLARRGVKTTADNLLITNGSQQGIDLIARVLLDPGDIVLTENPTYLAALQAFSAYEVDIAAVPSDDDGMITDTLPGVLARLDRKPKLIYIVADFHNPKGTTLPLARRQALYDVAARHGIPILEDDPYSELRFRGEAIPAIASLDTHGIVVGLGTFSKVLAPGLRVGWMHASPGLLRPVTIAKQAADLHTATLAQWATYELLKDFDLDGHLSRLRSVYGSRMTAMDDALRANAPAGTRWTSPEGGLFLWMTLPAGVKDSDVFKAALERSVAVVPGSSFFVGGTETGCLRLNFSNQSEARIKDGVVRLCDAIGSLM